ncbi:MAG: HAD family phosphatase [Verrucomicrobia bacterium]|nr:HAD family phosphatase [Verrucomicrobiota bacterium]
MSLPIELISTDFDGTLHADFENPPVPPALVDLIERLQHQGVKWVINTGRDLSSLMESMGRAHLRVKPDFLVTVEREIFIHEGHRYAPLEPWNSECMQTHRELFARVAGDLPRLYDWVNERFDATVYADDYSPFCLIAGNNGDADAIENFLADYSRSVPSLTVVRNDVYARFSHEDYNKGSALTEIARRLGITVDKILAAGDHFNDLPMLSIERARWLVAPANAIPVVQETVRRQRGFVSRHSVGHGIAEGIEACLRLANAAQTPA